LTAPQIIQEIEAAGGVLTVSGERLRYELPEEAAFLVDVLRQHRDEVLLALREREKAATIQVSRWLGARSTRAQRAWGAEKFLYCDYTAWCHQHNQSAYCRELFCAILNESFPRELNGWQGICLAVDFARATERVQ
jgi:hypothetical protein